MDMSFDPIYSLSIFLFFCGLGTPGIIAGVGLFFHQNWARRLGMIVTGSYLFLTLPVFIFLGQFIFFYGDAASLVLTLVNIMAFLYLSYLLSVLGGNRLASSTGQIVTRPGGIWPVFIVFSATGIGFLPAIFMLFPSRSSRIIAQIYAALLSLVMFGFAFSTFVSNLPSAGYILGNFVLFFWIGYCIWIFTYLNKPHVKNYFEGKAT